MHPLLATRLFTVEFDTIAFVIEVPRDIDEVIDYYAQHHAEDENLLPYYSELWPSALALAKYLLTWSRRLTGTRVIELGCGLGLPSLAAAARGAQVIATDFHPHNERFLRRNIALNSLDNIEYRLLDWNAPPRNLHADLIMGSDLVYEARNIDPFVRCASALCTSQGTVMLADPGRHHLQQTVLQMRTQGFEDELHIIDDIFVIEFSRSRKGVALQAHLPVQPYQV